MSGLGPVSRRRAVLATIADVIVAVAAGKGLRVAIACADPDTLAFADQLTRALHARGRPCRYLSPKPQSGVAPVALVALISSGGSDPDETELCRVDIRLTRQAGPVPADPTGGDVDILIDYADPAGPAIRHIVPALLASRG